MDIVLLTANPFSLPTSRRATAIVHDGPTDLRLWPGPSNDREITHAYGDLQRVLDQEVARLPNNTLAQGELLRLHPGKLHADYLLYIATRGPEDKSKRASAPLQDVLTACVTNALHYATERSSSRVAFPLLGEGPDSLRDAERMVCIAKACHDFMEAGIAAGRAPSIEEVVICAPTASITNEARKLLGASVRTVVAAEEVKAAAQKEKKAPVAKKKSGKSIAPKRAVVTLSHDEIARARASAQTWDRMSKYSVGDFFLHIKFGVGRVQEHTLDGFVMVLFEDQEIRKMIHQR